MIRRIWRWLWASPEELIRVSMLSSYRYQGQDYHFEIGVLRELVARLALEAPDQRRVTVAAVRRWLGK